VSLITIIIIVNNGKKTKNKKTKTEKRLEMTMNTLPCLHYHAIIATLDFLGSLSESYAAVLRDAFMFLRT